VQVSESKFDVVVRCLRGSASRVAEVNSRRELCDAKLRDELWETTCAICDVSGPRVAK
jgi:hypothetical protein